MDVVVVLDLHLECSGLSEEGAMEPFDAALSLAGPFGCHSSCQASDLSNHSLLNGDDGWFLITLKETEGSTTLIDEPLDFGD